MAITCEVPVREWRDYLAAFSDVNQGRPARLETTVSPGEGPPVLAEHQPLLAVDFDSKGSGAPAIMVTLGGLEAETPDFTHVITEPTRLWIEEEAGGQAVAMEIESRDEGRTLLVFEREAALPA